MLHSSQIIDMFQAQTDTLADDENFGHVTR